MNNLESLMQKGSMYLKKEFGLEKPKSGIKFCSKKEWDSIAIRNRAVEGVEAFYHSGENRVYALSSVSLPGLLHEFLGHALFSEQSFLGKKLKAYEDEIEGFEEKYNIPRYVVLDVCHSDSDKFRVEKNPGFQKFFKADLSKELTRVLEQKLLENKDASGFLESLSGIIGKEEYLLNFSLEDKSKILDNLKRYSKKYAKSKEEANIKVIEQVFDVLVKKNYKAVKDSGCEYILFCNTKDEEVQRYINLKVDYKAFFEKVRPVQEGFAVWMEKIILQGLGLDDLWNGREEKIKQNKYYHNAFQSFLADELNLGILSILCGLGFPKTSDKKILTRFAEENLKSFEGLRYLVKYGSGKRDLDMIAVYDDNVKIRAKHIYKENAADISLMNESEFLKKLNLFDIEITEPVLTGELLYGNETDYEKIKEWLLCTKPPKEAAEYSKRRSLETYNSATFFVNQHKYKGYNQLINASNADEVAGKILCDKNPGHVSKDLLYALVNLSFSLSYDSTAKHYSEGSNVIGFKDVLKSDKTLEKVMGYIKDVEHGREGLTEEKTDHLLELTKDKLLEKYQF